MAWSIKKDFFCPKNTSECQDKSWEDRNEQANEDEEKKTGRRRDKILLIFRMCELNLQVEVRVGQSSGFRLRVFMNL